MEQEFSLQTEMRGRVLVMATSGYINNVGGEAISSEFSRHFDNGVKNVVLNLSGSKVVNSIGISFLIDVLDRLNDADGKLIFTDLDPAVEKMLSIMGLFGIAGKENTVDDAIKILSGA